ncbi:ABC transporter ATP-binding protein [Olsenella massiliensis]|uniref:ABC transporter ATP-binding protein n=1 Tax=Olsenella massiliensis TaxID=1622075 RepID=UPI0009EA14A6
MRAPADGDGKRGAAGRVPAAPAGAASSDVAPALEAEALTLSWNAGDSVVVEDVSLSVGAGEVVCLVGRSGCGKTTIMHALSGLSRPLSGRVLLHGHDVTGTPGRVSYMLQKDLLLPSKRILDNVSLPLVLGGLSREQAHERARPLFERFGLKGTERSWPSELSGGMRQRAAFLRTYLMGNDVMLLDEPFSALDALTRSDMRSWYCDMAHELGIATLAITHDVDEAVTMARRVYVLAGNPASGVPSRVEAEVRVERPPAGVSAADFALTEGFLTAKREVLSFLR